MKEEIVGSITPKEKRDLRGRSKKNGDGGKLWGARNSYSHLMEIFFSRKIKEEKY